MTRVAFTYPGEPIAKERPRLGKNGNVYSPSSRLEAEMSMYCRKWRRSFPAGIPVSISITFFTDKRHDIDNLEKFVLDSVTKGEVWADDSQVRENHSRMLLSDGNPRTEVVISSMNGGGNG